MPNALDAVEVDTAGGIDGVFSLEAVLDLSTFRAVVDSDIAPVLDLFLGLRAWMPVYNLQYGAQRTSQQRGQRPKKQLSDMILIVK